MHSLLQKSVGITLVAFGLSFGVCHSETSENTIRMSSVAALSQSHSFLGSHEKKPAYLVFLQTFDPSDIIKDASPIHAVLEVFINGNAEVFDLVGTYNARTSKIQLTSTQNSEMTLHGILDDGENGILPESKIRLRLRGDVITFQPTTRANYTHLTQDDLQFLTTPKSVPFEPGQLWGGYTSCLGDDDTQVRLFVRKVKKMKNSFSKSVVLTEVLFKFEESFQAYLAVGVYNAATQDFSALETKALYATQSISEIEYTPFKPYPVLLQYNAARKDFVGTICSDTRLSLQSEDTTSKAKALLSVIRQQ